jgi:soluble lytic murein transglycosylase-like protein
MSTRCDDRHNLRTAGLRPLIDALAHSAGLPKWDGVAPGIWLEALILQESGGNPDATRYERRHDLKRRGADPHDRPGIDDGDMEDDKSYGLMQVLGSNVRALCHVPNGTPFSFSFLRRPAAGIDFGLRILTAELQHTGGDVPRALARYNGGPTGERRDAEGRMRCQAYVDGVWAWTWKVREDRCAAADVAAALASRP